MTSSINESGFSTKKIKQFFILLLIALIGFLLFNQLAFLLNAFLGAITMYVVLIKPHKYLMRKYHWGKYTSCIFLLSCSIVMLLIPFFFTVRFVVLKISPYIATHEPLIESINTINTYIKNRFDFILLSTNNLNKIKELAGKAITTIIGSGLIILTNLLLLYFLLWFMINNSFNMERWLKINSPFNKSNTLLLITEIKKTILNNAIGIIVLGLIQGLVAIIGYSLFGVKEPVLWGLITGAASVVPFAGTMLVWVPMTILLFASGANVAGIGLFFWGLFLIGGIDNVVRFILQKSLAQTHPLITVLGVIVGLKLFGFWGLIFGPLMIVLFIMFSRIYRNEYLEPSKQAPLLSVPEKTESTDMGAP